MASKLNSIGLEKDPKDTTVVVAMSGGVDSSTVAGIMKKDGYKVIGITLKLYDDTKEISKSKQCCAGQDIMDAKRVADKLEIEHKILYYQNKFKQGVIDNFVESYLKGETPSIRDVLPLGMFRLMLPYIAQINNIHLLEEIIYSHKLTLAGQVDCVAEYNGKLSVIDFKTANKERNESWIDNYFLQCTAYAIMYEEIFGKPIEQIVILLAGEDGSVACYKKK